MRTILSLFDYTGAWSMPYRRSGYGVIQVDLNYGNDIMQLEPATLPEVYGILAAPPCTHLAVSGARWFAEKDADGRTFEMIALMYKTLSIIWYLRNRDKIAWWCLENPVGRLNGLVPELQLYGPRYFQPCEHGDPYTKKTGLWGEFTMPLPTNQVEPVEGSKMHLLPQSPDRAMLRSATPAGFARAFYDCNK